MAAKLHFLDQRRLIDSNGIADGASIYFYATGTLTPATVYTTSALDVAHPSPIVVAAGAAVPVIYMDSAVTYRRRIVYPDGTVDDTDPYLGALFDPAPVFDNVVYSSQFASLSAALTAWASTGGTLVLNEDYSVASAISVSLTASQSYKLRAQGRVTLTYTGSETQYMLRILGANSTPLDVEGDIVCDGANLVRKAFYIDYQAVSGSDRADVRVSGVTGKNCKMLTAASNQAAAIEITGGIDHLVVEKCRALNVTRAAGVGTVGSQGSVGISLATSLSGTVNYKHVTVRDCVVHTVTTLDAAGTAAYSDMDGLLIFQGDEDGATPPIVENCWFYECGGRAIKIYSELGGGVVRDCHIFRSVQGVGTGASDATGSTDIAFQHGDGLVENCVFHYSGSAHTSSPTVPIGFANSAARTGTSYPMHKAVVRNITCADSTATEKNCLVSFFDNTGSTARRQCEVDGFTDTGTADQMIKLGGLGSVADADIRLSDIDCYVNCATRTDDNLPYLRVDAKRVHNRNGTAPIKRLLVASGGAESAGGATPRLGQWKGDTTVTGFHRYKGLYRGNPNFHYGFYGPGGGVEADPPYGKDVWVGPVRYSRQEIAAGATDSIASSGLYEVKGGDFRFAIKRHDQAGVAAIATTAAESTNFTTIEAGTGITLTSGGAAAGGSIFEVYKDSATQELRVRNGTAGTLYYDLVINP